MRTWYSKSFISSLPLCPPSQSSPNHLRHLLVGQTHKSTWPKNLVPESAARTEHLGRSRISKESMEKHGAKQEHSGKWFLRSVTHRRMTHHWKYPDCLYGRFITGHGMTPLWSQFQCSQLWWFPESMPATSATPNCWFPAPNMFLSLGLKFPMFLTTESTVSCMKPFHSQNYPPTTSGRCSEEISAIGIGHLRRIVSVPRPQKNASQDITKYAYI